MKRQRIEISGSVANQVRNHTKSPTSWLRMAARNQMFLDKNPPVFSSDDEMLIMHSTNHSKINVGHTLLHDIAFGVAFLIVGAIAGFILGFISGYIS
jgi:hypothetical protein